MKNNSKWDVRYLDLAKYIAINWSKDPKRQVGAVVTRNNYIMGLGFNGFPRGVADTEERLHSRMTKNLITIHAEQNAIYAAQGKGDTIYIWPLLPCSRCLGAIIQANISRIVLNKFIKSTSWNQELVLELIKETGITLDILTGPCLS